MEFTFENSCWMLAGVLLCGFALLLLDALAAWRGGARERKQWRELRQQPRRWISGFVIEPEHAEAFLRNNPNVMTAEECWRYVMSDPDKGDGKHEMRMDVKLADMAYRSPGKLYFFRTGKV